jgi:hypothetical protein
MRRQLLVASFLVGLPALVGLGIHLASSTAQTASPANAKTDAAPLPVSHVILYSSGVGYFQRQGMVEGNSRIDMTFAARDINDLIKSMVLQDLDGGRISAVSYDSHDPVDKTLKSFAIDFSKNPTFADVLHQARGEKIEVVLQSSNTAQPGTLTGSIIGVEQQQQPVGTNVVSVALLNLWCAEGMRSVNLGDVQRLRFLNPVMDSEVKRALEVLAQAHDAQKKAVSLSFTGEGKRQVQVGYVVENPIWKTSYRLVLGKDGKPFLQGWAIVENTNDEDWSGVRMALISGRPISFQMDLYQPLYVPRPVVEPELFASLRPPTYTGAMYREEKVRAELEKGDPADRNANLAEAWGKLPEKSRAAGMKPTAPVAVRGFVDVDGSVAATLAAIIPNQGVASAATATEMGDYFQYLIEQPVSLPRQKSALLPIINQNVEGTRVSIYNQVIHAKFPLLGLKFKNTTGLHLMQGPITVFDNNTYAGDSRFVDMQPKEERLISYAVDLGTEVEPIVKDTPNRLIAVKINKGIMISTTKIRETKVYNIKNRSEHDRILLVEHPFRADFKLLTPEKPAERARDVYRFEVKVPAGKSDSVEVIEERDLVQNVQLSNTDDQALKLFFSSAISSPAVKDALKRAQELKGRIASTQRELDQTNRQLQDIVKDQERLRANLKEMPPTAEAYKRYLKKFDDQETDIEKLQARIKLLQETEHQQRKEYEAFLEKLTVE